MNIKLTTEDENRLVKFFILLAEINQQNKIQHGTLPLPDIEKTNSIKTKLLHNASNSPYFGTPLYYHTQSGQKKENQN